MPISFSISFYKKTRYSFGDLSPMFITRNIIRDK